MVAEAVKVLQQAGVPCFPSGERAAVALMRLREREELLAAARRAPRGPLPAPRQLPWPPAELPGGLVLEPQGWAFLRGLGLPLPAFRWCRSAGEARETAEAAAAVESAAGAAPRASPSLRFPLVMKVVSPDVIHKSDRGGVLLGLKEPAAVERAFADLSARFAGASFQGVLLAEQVAGGLEVIVGLKRDPVFGPVVLSRYGRGVDRAAARCGRAPGPSGPGGGAGDAGGAEVRGASCPATAARPPATGGPWPR